MSIDEVDEMAEPRQEKLFGQPKYDVESLADNIMRSREAESLKPELYKAALKLLDRRKTALSAILRAATNKE